METNGTITNQKLSENIKLKIEKKSTLTFLYNVPSNCEESMWEMYIKTKEDLPNCGFCSNIGLQIKNEK